MAPSKIVYRYISILALLCIGDTMTAQTLQATRKTDWSKAGLKDTITSYSTIINIMSYGGVADGITPNDTAFQNALNALNHKPGTILFPVGNYLFRQSMNLQDSMVLQGTGSTSKLSFNLGGSTQNMINVQGSNDTGTWNISQPIKRNDTIIYMNNTAGLNIGDWIYLYGNDSLLITSSWAYGTAGQILQITDVQVNKITTDQVIRNNYPLSFAGKIRRLLPVKRTGIECLYIERLDSTIDQTSNINFTNAVNCWVIGVESNKTNFAHLELTRSSHITVRGNYFHHSQHYGGSGQGYGVAVQYTSGDCLVENNIFEHLRHSMLVQAGANGNVFAYNYSKDPFWNEPSLPTNAAGDAVCHGNYAYLNLFEGNILNNIVIDNSHGINGPFNTFFRNRAELYGIIQNTGPATDSMNYLGNEITNTGPFMGNYILAGNGYFEYGNNVKGIITPTGTSALPEHSLYITGTPGYWMPSVGYPNIGTPYTYNAGSNSARLRYTAGNMTDCAKNPKFIPNAVGRFNKEENNITIYPNPATQNISISSATTINKVEIFNLTGQLLYANTFNARNVLVDITQLMPGLYFVKINSEYTKQLIIQ